MRITRRDALRGGIATTTIAGLAGCTGGDGGGDGSDGGGDGGGDGGDGGGGSGGSTNGFPSETIEIVVPYGPGGGFDTYTRLVAKHLPDELGTDTNVRNVEGASGRVGVSQVFTSEASGYTLGIFNGQSHVRGQILNDTRYDVSEFTYFPQIAQGSVGITVSTQTDITTWDEFVDAVQNEELKFASRGLSSGKTIFPVLLGVIGGVWEKSKVLDNTVVYDGSGPTVQGVQRGDVHVMVGSPASMKPHIDEGIVRWILYGGTSDEPPELASAAETMSTASPEIADPKAIEDMSILRRGFFGPPDIPQDRVATLREGMSTVIQSDALNEEAQQAERPITYASSEEFRDAATNNLDSWAENEDLLLELTGQS